MGLGFSVSSVCDLHPAPLTGGVGTLMTSASGCTVPGNRHSLLPEGFGCSPCTLSKLCRAGTRQRLLRRWWEQVDGCCASSIKLNMQQVRLTNGGVSLPLGTRSAIHLCCVRKTSKYEPCHGTNFQLFDYPEPFWCG